MARLNPFPKPEDILPALQQEPKQAEIAKPPFSFTRGKNVYTVQPLFTYKLYGLVVSERHDNLMHQSLSDYANEKDLCVIWQDNITHDIQHLVDFSNTTWACSYRPKLNKAGQLLIEHQFSNNHLLSNIDSVRKEIHKVQKGDQIFLAGYLSSYSTNNGPARETSTSRYDGGLFNRACETIYVTNFKILKKSNRLGVILFQTAGVFLILGVFGVILSLLLKSMQKL